MNNKEQLIYDYLKKNHVGKDSAIHSSDLEKRFGICGRTLRSYVNNLRKCGAPICSDDKGYWYGKNTSEVNGTLKRLVGFMGEIDGARTGLAYANIQMRSITKIREENIEITVRVK